MTGRTFEDQTVIREWIRLYIDNFGVTSLSDIVTWVETKTNEKISRSTVARLVNRMGYQYNEEWVKK